MCGREEVLVPLFEGCAQSRQPAREKTYCKSVSKLVRGLSAKRKICLSYLPEGATRTLPRGCGELSLEHSLDLVVRKISNTKRPPSFATISLDRSHPLTAVDHSLAQSHTRLGHDCVGLEEDKVAFSLPDVGR